MALLSSAHDFRDQESLASSQWAIEQLAQAKLFEVENLNRQKDVDFLIVLHKICSENENFGFVRAGDDLKNIDAILDLTSHIGYYISSAFQDINGIPFAVLLAIIHSSLAEEEQIYNSKRYLEIANHFCVTSDLNMTIPLIAVICVKEFYLGRAMKHFEFKVPIEQKVPAKSVMKFLDMWSVHAPTFSRIFKDQISPESRHQMCDYRRKALLVSDGEFVGVQVGNDYAFDS